MFLENNFISNYLKSWIHTDIIVRKTFKSTQLKLTVLHMLKEEEIMSLGLWTPSFKKMVFEQANFNAGFKGQISLSNLAVWNYMCNFAPMMNLAKKSRVGNFYDFQNWWHFN